MMAKNRDFEDATPNPEHLIKSIAEQGYSLSTAIADLIDNSISANANRIEILLDTDSEPFTLFLADNGHGMSKKVLRSSMQFPSNSIDVERIDSDLGRFGLGMKTASFSQTRYFTVMSRPKGEEGFTARTWDVAYLKKVKKWRIIINTEEEIDALWKRYQALSRSYVEHDRDFVPNTLVVWHGLYKFENYLKQKNKVSAVQKEISQDTGFHLSLVFHRFMERKNKPLLIRLNNRIVRPFNPFPKMKDIRALDIRRAYFDDEPLRLEGFVLPERSIAEVQNKVGDYDIWSPQDPIKKSLMDMEGIYVYRGDRIIFFGGWNGLIRKSSRVQLARLRVEVGNGIDDKLHLNVAKSKIEIPHDFKDAFASYVEELRDEAVKEFYNRGIKRFSGTKKSKKVELFERIPSNKGMLLEVNESFPVLSTLLNSLNKFQAQQLRLVLRLLNTRLNKLRNVEAEETEDLDKCNEQWELMEKMLNNGILSEEYIKKSILPSLGLKTEWFVEKLSKRNS